MNDPWSLPNLSTRLTAKAVLFATIVIIEAVVGVVSILGHEYRFMQKQATQLPDNNRKSATPEPCGIAPMEHFRPTAILMPIVMRQCYRRSSPTQFLRPDKIAWLFLHAY
jgi:hypothetical protein